MHRSSDVTGVNLCAKYAPSELRPLALRDRVPAELSEPVGRVRLLFWSVKRHFVASAFVLVSSSNGGASANVSR